MRDRTGDLFLADIPGLGKRERNPHAGVLPFAMARVRQQATLGVLGDAFADDAFATPGGAIRTGARFEGQRGVIRGVPMGSEAIVDLSDEPVHRPSRHSSNSSVAIGDRLFLKGYRHIQEGVNPEAEMGRYLSEVVHFSHTVPVLGTLEYQDENGRPMTLALLQLCRQSGRWLGLCLELPREPPGAVSYGNGHGSHRGGRRGPWRLSRPYAGARQKDG